MALKITQELKDRISKTIDNMSREDIEKYFPKDTKPKGWLSIEDYLPKMMAMDTLKGATVYKVKYEDGLTGESLVCDHNIWYHEAKQLGVTHWFND